MKKKLFVFLFLALVVMMVVSVMAIPALAGPPENAAGTWNYAPVPESLRFESVGCNDIIIMTDIGVFQGTFSGTEEEDGMVVIYCNGKASFKGNLTFTGNVAGSEQGTLDMRIVGRSEDQSFWEGTWVIKGGTGGLATLKGQGSWWGPPGSLEYAGNYHFEPE